MLPNYIDNNLENDCEWYLAKTRARSEDLALATIENFGYSGFVPKVTMVNSPDEDKDVCIFPGYIFIRGKNIGSLLPDIKLNSFLYGWVEFDGIIASIKDQVISELKMYVKELNRSGGLWNRFEKGEMVEVFISGFAVKGKIIEEPDSPYDDALVVMDFMGRDIKTSVKWQYIGSVKTDRLKNKMPRRTRGKGRVIKNKKPEYLLAY